MAFTSLKNKITTSEHPVADSTLLEQEQTVSKESLKEINPSNETIKKFIINSFNSEKNNTNNNMYSGIKIEDLEKSGLQTISLLKLASNSVIEKTRFNLPLLESIPLLFVLQQFNSVQIKDNLYSIFGQAISLKENEPKWYNTTCRYGNVKAISLTKHLIAKQEGMNPEQERENDILLFKSACKQLSAWQTNAQENNKIQDNQETTTSTSINVNNSDSKTNVNIESSSVTKKSESIESNNSVAKNINVNSNESNEVQDEVNKINNNKINWKALTEQLNLIPLSQVLEYIGAHDNEDRKKNQWKIWATGHNVVIDGNRWKNWNGGGGYGAITLLMDFISNKHNLNLRDDKVKFNVRNDAINQLIKEFGKEYDFSSTNFKADANSSFSEPFCMPYILNEKLPVVKTYLHEKRHIPNWIIDKQISKGFIFAGFPSDWRQKNGHIDPALKSPETLSNEKVWAVFLAVNGNAAEMRAVERTDKYAKMQAKGSVKENGGFLIKAQKEVSEKTVAACEAAVDTLSYQAFFPGRIAMSCMGVNFNLAVIAALDALDNNYKFKLSYDNDLAGNEAAVSFREAMISELGEEEYLKLIVEDKISLFELGIKCFDESVKSNKIFYFDVKNNDSGIQAVKMFQTQLFKTYDKEYINKLISQGKIKYINIEPNYNAMTNVQDEAKKAYDLLKSGKPYYFFIKEADDDEKEMTKQNRIAFEEAFSNIAKNEMESFIKNGNIIYKKQAIAKDWNDLLIYKKNDPEFLLKLQQDEEKFTVKVEIKDKPDSKKPKK